MAVFGVFSAINIQNDTNGQLGYIDKTCYIQDSSESRTFYSTIEKAYASATDGDTICVFENISLSADSADFSVEKDISLMAVSSDVTLNLSGHNIVIGSGNTLVLGGGSNTLTLSSSSNNTIQNAGTLNVHGGIISSAEITNRGKLTFFGGQVDTIANTGLVTLSQSAQIKTIQTTQQTAGETDAGIFVSSSFSATSPIQLIISGGTPTPGQQVAYFEDTADAQNFADYFTLNNSTYFLHTSGNSLLIGQYITPPTVSGQSTFIYDGTLKTLQFSGLTSLMSVSGNTQTNAGDYTATVSLTDKTNYRWSDTRNSVDKEFRWSIDPAQLDYPTVEQDEFTYNTQAHSLVFSGLNNDLMEVSGTTSATNVGNYTAIVSLKDKQNYTWANNSTADYEIDWSIIKAQLTKPTAGTNSFTYTGNQITYTPSGYSSATMTISGNTGTNVRDYTATISIANTDNYEWTDGTTTSVSLTWHITPITLTKPTISGGPFTYDGNVKSVKINGFDANTMNREQYSATNAGTYTARVSLKDKENYTWADGTTNDVTYSWTINKRQLTIPTANPASYTYTGSAISVTFTNPDSAHITLGGDLTATVIGSYTATATIKDTANNEWTDGTTSVKNIVWSITKADLPTPTGLNWRVSSNKSTVTANWNSVAHASSYTVKVYVGSTLALTESGLTSTSHTFTASEFNNLSEGTYTFRVQAMGNSNYNDSSTATSGNLYRLVYRTNYGTSTVHARQYYTQYQTISAPSAPSRTGYNFIGWATTNTATSANLPSTARASDTYYAVWLLTTYTIKFERNSGTWASGYHARTSYNINSGAITLPTADNIYRTNYIFVGWYESSNFSGDPVTSIPAGSTGNKTYYASWTEAAVYNTTRNLGYSDLTTAIEEANAGETLDVLSNLTSTETYIVDKSLTIQANTNDVEVEGSFNVSVGHLILGGGAKSLTITSSVDAITISGTANLTTNNLIVNVTTNYSAIVSTTTGEINLVGGKMDAVNSPSLFNNVYCIDVSAGTLTISNVMINSDTQYLSLYNSGAEVYINGTQTIIYGINNSIGTMTINNGKIFNTSSSSSAIENSGTLTVCGGTITAGEWAVMMSRGDGYGISNSGTLIINDDVTISGGDSGLYIDSGLTEISKGSIKGNLYGIYCTGGDININISGGSFIGTQTAGIYNDGGNINISEMTMIVEISSDNYGIFNRQGTIEISAGTVTGEVGIRNAHEYSNSVHYYVTYATLTVSGTANIIGTQYGIENVGQGSLYVKGGIIKGSSTTSSMGICISTDLGDADDVDTAIIEISGGEISGYQGINTNHWLDIDDSNGKVSISGSETDNSTDNNREAAGIHYYPSAYTADNNNISAGTINGYYGIYVSGSISDVSCSLVISGTAEIVGTKYGIYNESNGTVNIRGGTVSATASNGTGIYNFSGIVNISGGTIQTTGRSADSISNSNGTVDISGTAQVTAVGRGIYSTGSSSNVNISDGTINGSTYCIYLDFSTTLNLSGSPTFRGSRRIHCNIPLNSSVPHNAPIFVSSPLSLSFTIRLSASSNGYIVRGSVSSLSQYFSAYSGSISQSYSMGIYCLSYSA